MAGFHERSRVEMTQLAAQQQQQLAAQERRQFAVYKVPAFMSVLCSAMFHTFGMCVDVDAPAGRLRHALSFL